MTSRWDFNFYLHLPLTLLPATLPTVSGLPSSRMLAEAISSKDSTSLATLLVILVGLVGGIAGRWGEGGVPASGSLPRVSCEHLGGWAFQGSSSMGPTRPLL